MDVAAVILAGGGSTRMGRDKAAIEIGGRTLLQRVVDAAAEVADSSVVVLAPGRALPRLETRGALRLTTDPVEGQGPLAGILAGLALAQADVALLLACDQPFVRPALLRLLVAQANEAAAVVPVVEGRPQPLCSAVRSEAADGLRDAYARGARGALAVLDLDGAVRLEPAAWRTADPEGLSFVGANTPEELARCEQLAARLDA